MVSRPPQRAAFRVRLELGLAAFAPAFALLAFRSRSSDWAFAFVIIAAAGTYVLVAGSAIVRKANKEPFTFGDIEDLSSDVTGHVAAYLVPAFVDTSEGTEAILVSLILVALIVHIHVATGRVLVNPLLFLFGYRIYIAKSGSSSFYLVARSDVSGWTDDQLCARIGSNILVERQK